MPILRSPEIPLDVRKYQDAILETFPKHAITGMDPERAEHFIRSQGLRLAEYVVIEESDVPTLNHIIGKSGLLRGDFQDRGLYAPELQLAIYMKHPSTRGGQNPNKYVGSSPLHREATLVHELAHGSGNFREYIYVSKTEIYTPRSGFVLTVAQHTQFHGDFLEEGFADMMRARYTSQYISKDQTASLAEKMYLEQPGLEDTLPAPISGNRVTPLPVKYFFVKEPENQPAIPGYFPHAAYAIELLIRKNPELNDAIIRARGTVAGLRRVAQILDRIQPGLYWAIQRTPRTEDDFVKIKSRVIREIMGGYSQIIQGGQQLIDYWNQILGN